MDVTDAAARGRAPVVRSYWNRRMNAMAESALLLSGAALVSWIGTAVVIRGVRARGMLDVPNERSSHAIPTPRGGGLAIALTASTGIALARVDGRIETTFAAALFGGALAIA